MTYLEYLHIGDRRVGPGEPTYIIAEVGINHNGLLPYAIKLIDAAVEAGADAVKFQKRHLPSLYSTDLLDNPNVEEKGFQYLLPFLRETELTDDEFRQLNAYCCERGIVFLCSPWDILSVDFLESLDVPAYKTGSADMTNLPLLEYIVSKGKPILVSTGMSTYDEVQTTAEFLKGLGAEFALLHCNSTYPSAFENVNLRFMEVLREFGVPVGYSGHERGIAVSTVAAALGACIIERHITLDRTMEGPDHAASLEPHGFKKMVRDIRLVTVAMGTGQKGYSQGEMLNRELLAKSLVAARSLSTGTVIARDMVMVRGPGTGLSPQRLEELIGKTLQRDMEAGELFREEDVYGIPEHGFEGQIPWEWGFVVRFRDFRELLAYKPQVLEFHLTYEDMEQPRPAMETYAPKLVVHAPEFWHRSLVDLCTDDRQHRQASIAIIQQAIDIARELAPHFPAATPRVIVHPGAMSLEPLGETGHLMDNLRTSVAELDYEGVELLPENLPPRPWYFGGQWATNAFMAASQIKAFCDESGLNICYDTSHSQLYCNLSGAVLTDEIRTLRPYVRHLHLSDALGINGEGLQIGEGMIDFAQAVEALGDGPYTMVPEIWRGHRDGGQGLLLALERLEAHFAKVE